MSLLCCLSGEREAMARDVLYIEDSPYQQNKSIMLCMIPDPALPWFSPVQVPSATVTKSDKRQLLWAVRVCLELQGQPEQACAEVSAAIAALPAWSCLG